MSGNLSETVNELVFLGKDFRVFELENLLSSSAETLGKGTFGYTYVVDLEGKDDSVVVKRFKVACVSETEFVERVELLGKMAHENLLPVQAYCCQKETRRLVYDYMPMGSLSSHLHDTSQERDKTTTKAFSYESQLSFSLALFDQVFGNKDNRNWNHGWFGKWDGVYTPDELFGFEAELLGKGSLCSSYKVFLDSGIVLSVKIFFGDYGLGIEREKLHALGELVHENLVPLRAYGFSKLDKLLIRDYMPKGSLFIHLHGSRGIAKTPLSWENRGKIAYGVACGINYLHSVGPNVCHGNIRSSNVFLTESYDARLSEFGLAQLISSESKALLAAEYRAPEVTFAHQVSQQSDVYSFGVLLLELLTGEGPSVNLPGWVRSTLQENPIIEVFDNEMKKNEKSGEQMVVLLQVAICCTFQYPNNRPLMSAVTDQIKNICTFS